MTKLYSVKKSQLFFLLFSLSLTFMTAQTVIRSQEFDGTGNWNYTPTINNGEIETTGNGDGQYTGASTAVPNCLRFKDYWTNTPGEQEFIVFDQVSITGLTAVQFSMDYAVQNLSANDQLRLIYSIDGAAPTTIVLAQGGNGDVTFTSNTNNGTGLANPYILNVGTGSTLDITVSGFSDNTGGEERYYMDDMTVTGTVLNPIASDDTLDVLTNSIFGTANAINVGLNDNIGTSDGSDGADYQTPFTPFITTQGGIVIEDTDGVFVYQPAADFIGTDSFTYTICDAGGDCDTGTVTIKVNFGACVPSSNSSGTHYINNFSLTGEGGNINNTSGDNGGYADFFTLPALSLYKGKTYPASVNLVGANMGWGVYIDLNKDGDFDDPNEAIANTGGEGTGPLNLTIPITGLNGKTIMRVGARRYWWSNDPCGNFGGEPEEFEDYLVDLSPDPTSPQKIDIISQKRVLVSGATVSRIKNGTNYGVYDVLSFFVNKTITIINNGGSDLTLAAVPVVVSDSGDGTFNDFMVTDYPDNLTIPSGGSETFDLGFNPTVAGPKSAIVSIYSDDPTFPVFTYRVDGEGGNSYPDTDGDTFGDNFDQDDDNDGILDQNENSKCMEFSHAGTGMQTLLFEDFGEGTSKGQIATVADDGTGYCYEEGDDADCTNPPYHPTSLNDGEYTIHYQISDGDGVIDADRDVDLAEWAEDMWYTGEDHTPGDTNGRMAVINADEQPGIMYANGVIGGQYGAEVFFSFWVLNIDRHDAPGIATRVRPGIAVQMYTPTFTPIPINLFGFPVGTTGFTGDIPPSNPALPEGGWIEITGSVIVPNGVDTLIFVLSNYKPGGLGNDLAIDDIRFTQALCDIDLDGVADAMDLDNDNDGVPDVVELGYADNDKDASTLFDPVATWSDLNFNGAHDAFEALTPRDTDGDGAPDYLDLDSDNDGIFDNVEYDNKGDIDVSGDALAVGSDVAIGNPADEQDGDGILGIMDLNDDGVGSDFGSTSYPDPIDTDGDGTPDYLDPFSNDATNNPANGSDIGNTIYAYLDADNDGIIDGPTDADGDGILDAFDTDDALYGSPRDLDESYTLSFDGRNDYVEDVPLTGGMANASLMSWIKIATDASGNRVILGQSNFFLQLDNSNLLSATANGVTVNYGTAIPENIWVHVGAIYDSTNGNLKLLVNGTEEDSQAVAGNLPADATNLTIGRTPSTDSNYFDGQIDEIRVFDKALTNKEYQRMVYQELDDTASFNEGKTIPRAIEATLGTSLIRYFKMDGFQDDILDDKTSATIDTGTGAKIYNVKVINHQTAPLPYETGASGDWSNTNTWLHGDVWDIADEANNKDWSIVHVKHNTTTSSNHSNLGMIVDPGTRLDILDNSELRNVWHLNLEGTIDLKGESQLIQTADSELVTGAAGSLERDQQGTENLYTYNYWSSPVHSVNPNAPVDGDETYSVGAVLLDGTDVNAINPITYTTSYDGSDATSPITISSIWLYKFDNRPEDDYSEWQYVGPSGVLEVGEGFTMKGPSSGPVSDQQNYTFVGKPNNGTITLSTTANNEYLVGNPYPSAIDAYEFILDNPHLDGTLYFWEHFGGGSHRLEEYQGGYGLYNLSGGTPPVDGTAATPDPGVNSGGSASKVPKRYIPVSQGFFVNANTTGDTTFENDQRIFVKESGGNSIFYRTNNDDEPLSLEDTRRKLRIGYHSPEGYKRQLLLTEDKNATVDIDWGYDGKTNEEIPEDMFWSISEQDYIIQAIDTIQGDVILPLNVKTKEAGIIEINIEALEHINDDISIFLKDNEVYHNLRESKYLTTVEKGITSNRFEIVLKADLQNENVTAIENDFSVFFENASSTLTITNPKKHLVKEIQSINMLGQVVFTSSVNSDLDKIKTPMSLQPGSYIFKIIMEDHTINKKAIISH